MMNENISMASVNDDLSGAASSRAFMTIVCGGLTVGVLDCLAATISAGLKGVTFTQVWQYVASGALGRESYNYGWGSVFLGLFFHFFIAFSVVTVFYLASRQLPILIRQPFLFGPLYGIAVFFVMSFAVVPLSRVTQSSPTLRGMLTGLFIHIICIGLPTALIVRHFSQSRAQFL